MSFRLFIYYCSLCGGCAAYVGWLMGRIPPIQQHVFQAAVKGLFLGLVLACVLTLIDVLWNLAGGQGAEACWRLLVGSFVGALGGFVGGMIGQLLYGATEWAVLLLVGWAITGLLIGTAPGMFDLLSRLSQEEPLSGARRKVLHGLLGGGVGGILGGVVYLILRALWGVALKERTDEFWSPSASGFVALGLCIGLMIGLAQVILKEAWIKVEEGFRAGRELILTKPETTVGRAESCDVGLFGDNRIEKVHLKIVQRDGRYYLEDQDTPDGTMLNGEPIDGSTPLHAGDRIELGRCVLRFGERAKAEE